MGRFEKLMRWMNVLVIFATFFAYLSPFINPIQFWQFSFFGLIYPWLLLSNLLFVLFWGFRKKKYFLFSLCCIIMGWGHVRSFVGFNFFEKTIQEEHFTIGSYNVHGLQAIQNGLKKNQRAKKEKQFVEFLSHNKIHILCSQETSNKHDVAFIQKEFNLKNVVHFYGKSPVIFSIYPIIESGLIEFGHTSNACVWADVRIKGKIVRVYSVHFQSNHVSSTADRVMAEKDFKKIETFFKIKRMMGKFRYFTKLRAQQVQKVVDHMSTCTTPIIFCGDFNDTPQSFAYHLLTKKLKDTFKERGKGFGTTYAGNIPALRIDYILLDKKIKVHNHEILKENFSDHYPVICKISL